MAWHPDRARFARDMPPLIFCTSNPGHKRIRCVFCGHDELRVGGPRKATFLRCPACGADGPVGTDLEDACRRYLARPEPETRSRTEKEDRA